MGHLRPVKDPFLTARAIRNIPDSSKIQLVHLGSALSKEMELKARQEEAQNHRYHWLGEVSHDKALEILGQSCVLSLTSKLEGGANVICEALALSVPVVASKISGNLGLLGDDYAGYFEVENAHELRDLLLKAEEDSAFYQKLKQQIQARAHLVTLEYETQCWRELLSEIWPGG